ncbi:MAG: hypothetical protein KatS3mg042_1360 [Rhodothermaceae bacterium]|nr:MAG: hypothetical protein KatS3mg042_1360 [Rhodothermaceae bacterium]
MKVTVLEPVEPLTPVEVCRRTGVPMDWLLRMLDRNKIAHVKSSYLRLINSCDLDAIRAMYEAHLNRRRS